MFSCGRTQAAASPVGRRTEERSGSKRKRGRTEPRIGGELAKQRSAESSGKRKQRFEPSQEARLQLPPDLLKKAEAWLREAVHILNLAQCVSTDPTVKSGLFDYASELLVSAIKLDADGNEVPRVLVDVTKELAVDRLRLHAEGVMHLVGLPEASKLSAKYKAVMIACAKELFLVVLRRAPSDRVAQQGLDAANKAAFAAMEQRRSESPYQNTRSKSALQPAGGKENRRDRSALADPSPVGRDGGCCARPSKPRPALTRTSSGTIIKALDLDDRTIRKAARDLKVHYSTGLAKGKLHFTRATRLPASIEDLCRLVCKDELTASGAVLCGSRWVPLSQLIDVPEARRIGAAAMRRGKLDAAANPSFDELSGTLCSEIAQRLPRYPVRLHVYDLGQAKGISGLNIVTKGLQMGGMFHGAIEIHGVEWSFGWADKGFTGVFDCQPTTNELHRHRETIELGWTWMGSKETRSLIRDLEHEWMGPSYDFLRRNCCHFCDELASRLAPGLSAANIPPWLNRLARGGASVADNSKWLFASKKESGAQAAR